MESASESDRSRGVKAILRSPTVIFSLILVTVYIIIGAIVGNFFEPIQLQNIFVDLGVRCYLWNNGNSSRTKSGTLTNFPSRSGHFRRGWRTRPPRRTRRGTHTEKILVSWRRVLPRNLAKGSPNSDDLLGINPKSLDRSATGDVLCNIRTSFGLDGT